MKAEWYSRVFTQGSKRQSTFIRIRLAQRDKQRSCIHAGFQIAGHHIQYDFSAFCDFVNQSKAKAPLVQNPDPRHFRWCISQ